MNNINKEEAAGIITRILMACRIPSNWAKVLAGAIIGAVVAWMSLTQSSCASKTQADPPGHTGISILERKNYHESMYRHRTLPVRAWRGK